MALPSQHLQSSKKDKKWKIISTEYTTKYISTQNYGGSRRRPFNPAWKEGVSGRLLRSLPESGDGEVVMGKLKDEGSRGRQTSVQRVKGERWLNTTVGQLHAPMFNRIQFSSVQSLSRVQLFVTPWITAHQAILKLRLDKGGAGKTGDELGADHRRPHVPSWSAIIKATGTNTEF